MPPRWGEQGSSHRQKGVRLTIGTTPTGPWWLNRAALISLIGLGLSALFALTLGFFIPNRVAAEFLDAQATADQASLDFLISSDAIESSGEIDFERLDIFVEQSILRGDFVRAKLWAVDGTILYSDATDLIGRNFVVDEDFPTLFEPMSHVSDLDHPENVLEAEEFDGRLLETYVPVVEGGEVLAVWEIYRPLDDYEASVQATQQLVWWSVGSGLVILGLFLVFSFGQMIRTANHQKQRAESRSEDLERLLEVAQATTAADGTSALAEQLETLLGSATEVEAAQVVWTPSAGEPRVLIHLNPELLASGDGEIRPSLATSEDAGGSLTVAILPSEQWLGSATPQALAEEINLGFQKVLLVEGLNDYREQLERVMDKIVVAEEGERRRLAGDLHDSLAQDLYRILYELRNLAADAPKDMSGSFEEIEGVVLEASRSLRRVLRDLHPTVVEDVGLSAALRSLADRINEEYGLNVDLELDNCPEPTEEVSLSIYRIAQEALVNAAKHSQSDWARLHVGTRNGRLALTIEDGGPGLASSTDPGMGIWLMRERAENLGGHVEFGSSESGLRVYAEVPQGGVD